MTRRYDWVIDRGVVAHRNRNVRREVESYLSIGHNLKVVYGRTAINPYLGILDEQVGSFNPVIEPASTYFTPDVSREGVIVFQIKEDTGDDDNEVLNFNIYSEEVVNNVIGYGLASVDTWLVHIQEGHQGKKLSDFFYLIAESVQAELRTFNGVNNRNQIRTQYLECHRSQSHQDNTQRTLRRLVSLGYSPDQNGGGLWTLA
jgi:hypothetical protein